MSLIPKIESCEFKEIEQEGMDIYKSNKTMADIAHFMEHPESRMFYEKYLNKQWSVEGMLFLLSLYREIDDESKRISENMAVELNAYHKLAVLDKVMMSRNLRRKIIDQYSQSKVLDDDGLNVNLKQF